MNTLERASAFASPATHCNRFLASRTGESVRIAFGERDGPDAPFYVRAAVEMSREDAQALAGLLTKLIG